MGSLTYFTIASLDGFVEDSAGRFQWGAPDEETSKFVNDFVRPTTTHLLGRRMYEVMLFWESYPEPGAGSEAERDFAEQWRGADKIVFSRSLKSPSSERTRIESRFDPAAVLRLKGETRGDLSVAGANLAGQAITAGLVDELQLLVAPIVVGGGKPWLPKDVRLDLELVDSHKFESGFVFLRYRIRQPKPDPGRNPSQQ